MTKTHSQESDPFVPEETTEVTEYFYHDVMPNGNVAKMKLESGIPVVVEDLGKAADWMKKAVTRMMMLTPKDVSTLDLGEMTHLELASLRLAMAAAAGCLKSTQEMFDRVMGRPKQVNENYNANVSLDDILLGKDRENEKGVVDVNLED
ncbi:MAG: hypothetical protein M0P69_01690 [Bacteroidales bacterium]|nr:hypothetical protein [Bacteroidales bacterium]